MILLPSEPSWRIAVHNSLTDSALDADGLFWGIPTIINIDWRFAVRQPTARKCRFFITSIQSYLDDWTGELSGRDLSVSYLKRE